MLLDRGGDDLGAGGRVLVHEDGERLLARIERLRVDRDGLRVALLVDLVDDVAALDEGARDLLGGLEEATGVAAEIEDPSPRTGLIESSERVGDLLRDPGGDVRDADVAEPSLPGRDQALGDLGRGERRSRDLQRELCRAADDDEVDRRALRALDHRRDLFGGEAGDLLTVHGLDAVAHAHPGAVGGAVLEDLRDLRQGRRVRRGLLDARADAAVGRVVRLVEGLRALGVEIVGVTLLDALRHTVHGRSLELRLGGAGVPLEHGVEPTGEGPKIVFGHAAEDRPLGRRGERARL